jgi:SAM-dependent methyltransferase
MQSIPEQMTAWPEPKYVKDLQFSIQQDLQDFTGLPEATVVELLQRPKTMSFTDEWLSTPDPLRHDQWFYLSSKFYLFANSIHRHAPGCGILDPDTFRSLVPTHSHVLDYAGGTGNCALSMASLGYVAHYRELSALQASFVRFRTFKHKLPVVVHDWWAPLPDDFFAFICFDSIGHVVDQKRELLRMIRALQSGGRLFLSLEDFTVPNAFEASDPRRWSMGEKEQFMHMPNQIGDISRFLASQGMEWNDPCWIKA